MLETCFSMKVSCRTAEHLTLHSWYTWCNTENDAWEGRVNEPVVCRIPMVKWPEKRGPLKLHEFPCKWYPSAITPSSLSRHRWLIQTNHWNCFTCFKVFRNEMDPQVIAILIAARFGGMECRIFYKSTNKILLKNRAFYLRGNKIYCSATKLVNRGDPNTLQQSVWTYGSLTSRTHSIA